VGPNSVMTTSPIQKALIAELAMNAGM
jgi:hypothetical protein